MDNFDLDSLEKFIRKYKRNIVGKLENLQLTEKEMRNQSDNLCMVLDYSPRVLEEKKSNNEKFKIKNLTIQIPINKDKSINSPTLNLESKQTDKEDGSSNDGSKGSPVKYSRFSNKLKMDLPTENQQLNFIMKTFTWELINKILDNMCSKAEEDDESDDDEYYRMIEQRNQRIEQGQKKISKSIAFNPLSNSKFANKFTETTKIRVYLLNTQNYVDVGVGINDNFKDMKVKILNYLEKSEKEGKIKLKFKIIDAYELRMIEDDDDEILPNMEFPPFEDRQIVYKTKNDYMSFVEKINFNPDTDVSLITSNNILGTTVTDSETVNLM